MESTIGISPRVPHSITKKKRYDKEYAALHKKAAQVENKSKKIREENKLPKGGRRTRIWRKNKTF